MAKGKIAKKKNGWEAELEARLPLFGHRNWIVVADAAYPAHSSSGIETVVAGADHLRVLEAVLKTIAAQPHIRAKVYLDSELKFVAEKDAPGVTKLRRQLDAALSKADRKDLPHEEIIAKLDESARRFRILLVKTDLTIPYTSVFLELDCGYWSAAAEQRLRKSMPAR